MPFDCTPSETIPAPLTLEDLIAWLRTKPAEETYCYMDNGRCLMAQFLKDTGICADARVVAGAWRSADDYGPARYVLFPGAKSYGDGRNWANEIAIGWPHNFGAALARALTYAATGKA